jgi:hypothetical protein
MSVMVSVSGCTQLAQSQSPDNRKLDVVPFSTRHAIALTAADVVNIMRAANFSDQQIYQYGPQIRNALMTVGGVQVQYQQGDETKVLVRFVINADDYVLVNSVVTGYFVYDARNHQFGLRPSTPAQQPPAPTPVQ